MTTNSIDPKNQAAPLFHLRKYHWPSPGMKKLSIAASKGFLCWTTGPTIVRSDVCTAFLLIGVPHSSHSVASLGSLARQTGQNDGLLKPSLPRCVRTEPEPSRGCLGTCSKLGVREAKIRAAPLRNEEEGK